MTTTHAVIPASASQDSEIVLICKPLTEGSIVDGYEYGCQCQTTDGDPCPNPSRQVVGAKLRDEGDGSQWTFPCCSNPECKDRVQKFAQELALTCALRHA